MNVEIIKSINDKLHLKHTTGELDTLCDDEVMVIAEFEHSVRIAPLHHLNVPLAKNIVKVSDITKAYIEQSEYVKRLEEENDTFRAVLDDS